MNRQLRERLAQVDRLRVPDDFNDRLATARETPFPTDVDDMARRSSKAMALVVGLAALAISVVTIATMWPRGVVVDSPRAPTSAGYSTSTDLACPGESIGSMPNYSNPPRAGSPIDLSRERLAHPTSADSFHVVRDTGEGLAYVFVERDGHAIARFVYSAEPDGRWTFVAGLECATDA